MARFSILLFVFLCGSLLAENGDGADPPPACAGDALLPNVIIIFCNDLGYADLGCYGATDIPTPHLDRMAAEGVRFTNFYATASVCMPSRAGLMTGCYPARVGISANVHPHEHWGLHPEETTIAEVFRQQGYATGICGKWHLGHEQPLLPRNQGFDTSLIIPYSHDMYRGAPWGRGFTERFPSDAVPMISGEKRVRQLRTLEDFSQLTTLFHNAAEAFVRKHAGKRPFFLYLPHAMPHLEIQPPEAWKGKSDRGPYGDVVAELDNAVGRLLEVLKETGIDEETLVVFSSDNGPARIYQQPVFAGGSTGPLSGQKGSLGEGGFRVPGIFRWRGKIPANRTCDAFASTIDLLPTCAGLVGAELPKRKLDGTDIRALLFNPATIESPHESFLYFHRGRLAALRSGRFKLWLKENKLYDLQRDPGEKTNVARQHPATVTRLKSLAEKSGQEIRDHARPVFSQ